MDLLNQIGIGTRHGYRLVELHCGDLTEIETPVDVLVISSAVGGYYPSRGTVIEALERKLALRVASLEENPEFDLRPGLRTWLSGPLTDLPFARVACVETPPTALNAGELLSDAFVALTVFEAKGIEIKSVVMPVLGAGGQGHRPHRVARALLEAVGPFLERSLSASRVRFVEIDRIRAEILNGALNEVLGRPKVGVPDTEFARSIRDDIHSLLPALAAEVDAELAGDIARVLEQPLPEAYDLGMHGRRLVECLVSQMSTTSDNERLYQRINGCDVAPWIKGYMHVLRYIGNEAVHYRGLTGAAVSLPTISASDTMIALSCIQRLLSYWREWSANRGHA